MNTMSNSPTNFQEQAFPGIRTAFYAQTGSESEISRPKFAQKKKKADPYSPEGMDPWVYEFSRENSYGYPIWHTLDEGPGDTRISR